MDPVTNRVTNQATNIVVCFDHDRADGSSTIDVLSSLFDRETQLTWRSGARGVADAYRFVAEYWEPGDSLFVFGAGAGGYRAHALTRLLDTVGIQHDGDGLLDYILANWALPRTHRTAADWERLDALAAELRGGRPAAPVRYLGVWDATRPAGLQPLSAPTNIRAGRHAVAIDTRRTAEDLSSPRVEQVWFRGTHADITGTGDGAAGLTRIALDWVLDGARRAGLRLAEHLYVTALPTPVVHDALAAGRRAPAMNLLAGVRYPHRLRVVPEGALVHASVEFYLARQPHYWYRLPHCLTWADWGWPERGERLLAISAATPLEIVEVLENAS